MPELTKDIIVAMLENGYIVKYDNVDNNIEEICKAIQKVNQELIDAKYNNTPTKK